MFPALFLAKLATGRKTSGLTISPRQSKDSPFLALGAVLQSPPMRSSQFGILQFRILKVGILLKTALGNYPNFLLSFRKQPQVRTAPSARRRISLLFWQNQQSFRFLQRWRRTRAWVFAFLFDFLSAVGNSSSPKKTSCLFSPTGKAKSRPFLRLAQFCRFLQCVPPNSEFSKALVNRFKKLSFSQRQSGIFATF